MQQGNSCAKCVPSQSCWLGHGYWAKHSREIAFEYSKLAHAPIPPALEKAPVKCRREGGGGGTLPRVPRSLTLKNNFFFPIVCDDPFVFDRALNFSLTASLYCTILTHMGKKIRSREITSYSLSAVTEHRYCL